MPIGTPRSWAADHSGSKRGSPCGIWLHVNGRTKAARHDDVVCDLFHGIAFR